MAPDSATVTEFPVPSPGDRVRIDTTGYGLPGEHWCCVLDVSDQPLYPLHLMLPEGATEVCDQFEMADVKGWKPR